MGRKTLETFPQKQPLKNRVNIILTRDKGFTQKDAVVLHSIDELMEELKKYKDDDVYVIGGESIYEQLMPYCNTAHITKIDYEYQADAYLQNLDKSDDWRLVAESDEQTYFNLEYYFLKYEKVSITD
jgi:dihydrofolate reductase